MRQLKRDRCLCHSHVQATPGPSSVCTSLKYPSRQLQAAAPPTSTTVFSGQLRQVI